VLQAGAELLIDQDIIPRADRYMREMAKAAPAGTSITKKYAGHRSLLVLYGAGAPDKLAIVGRHKQAGGRVAMFDLGYWDRKEAMRLSIDTMHPTAEQLALAPGGRRRNFTLREDADPNGPILLVGLGRKSCVAWGLQPLEWEVRKAAELQARFPGRRILWRPKGKNPVSIGDLDVSHGNPIDEALRGCSLVVCRHSNVAIDACIAGIPVECEDGAGFALYGKSPSPTGDERAEFLRRLAWWEWHNTEAAQAWNWINEVIG